MSDLHEHEAAILNALDNGAETVRDINERVAFNRRRVNYLLVGDGPSLETRGLVTVERPGEKRVRVDDGDQVRNRWAAKRVALTEAGVKVLIEADVDGEEYQDVSKEELLERVHDLEDQVARLEHIVKRLRESVQAG